MCFKEKFRYCRKTLCFTQQQLANELHVSKRMIAYYESGEREPSTNIIGQCAKIFHVPLSYLLIDEVTDPGKAFIEEAYRVELNRYKNSGMTRRIMTHIMAAGGDLIDPDNPYYDVILESIAKVIASTKKNHILEI